MNPPQAPRAPKVGASPQKAPQWARTHGGVLHEDGQTESQVGRRPGGAHLQSVESPLGFSMAWFERRSGRGGGPPELKPPEKAGGLR